MATLTDSIPGSTYRGVDGAYVRIYGNSLRLRPWGSNAFAFVYLEALVASLTNKRVQCVMDLANVGGSSHG